MCSFMHCKSDRLSYRPADETVGLRMQPYLCLYGHTRKVKETNMDLCLYRTIFDLNLGNDRSVHVAIEALFMRSYRPTYATVRPFVLP